MKIQLRTIGVVFIILMAAWGSAHAQVVDIPDQQLRVAVYDALRIPADASVTRADMLQLTGLDVTDRGIENLSGLEFATNLTWLSIAYNPVTDLRPIAGLTKLHTLHMWATPVSDITPLANLTNLEYFHANYSRIADMTPLANLLKLEELSLEGNAITDVTPLANLTQLRLLNLNHNDIVDVRPLVGLTRLKTLTIKGNRITDHSPLDGLSLTRFEYDDYQPCNEPPRPLQPRLENRSFPSVFSAWGGVGGSSVLNQPHLSDVEQMAQHDLYWCCLQWGHEFRQNADTLQLWGVKAPDSMDGVFEKNPNMIYLAGLGAVWEGLGTFPPDSDYWLRDEQGKILPAWDAGLVDLNHPEVQKRIIDRAVAVSKCGLYDGIFFDGWAEWGRHRDGTIEGTEAILKGIRERVHDNFLILVNTNTHTAPVSAPYVNGLFLESLVPEHWDDPTEGFRRLETTLSWAETNLRAPQINALEGWAYEDEPLDSPNNLRWMRSITTLSLTFSNGYVLFMTDWWEGDHKHWHYWYDFWDADLGQPVGEKSQLYEETPGLYIREFTNGWAVYNHSGVPQVVTLPEKVQAVASGLVNTEHALPNLDGEMYLRIKPKNPADVNGDGVVNIFDLTIVAQAIGTDDRQGDVNGDGRINVFDLVLVANAF